MSYLTIIEADYHLAHNAAWLALSDTVKLNHIATSALWLNYAYDWPGVVASCAAIEDQTNLYQGLPYSLPFTLVPGEDYESLLRPAWPRVNPNGGDLLDCEGCPITGIPVAVKYAQAIALEQGLTVPLFASATSSTGDGLVKKAIKAGSVSIELGWAEPQRGTGGQLSITKVDAALYCIACKRGTSANIGIFVV